MTDAQPQALKNPLAWLPHSIGDGDLPATWAYLHAMVLPAPAIGAPPAPSDVRNFFYDWDIETPAAGVEFFLDIGARPQANGFVPPMDMKLMGAAAENRPVIGRFELALDEALIQD